MVDFYEQVGYLPEAIINYLALLGLVAGRQGGAFQPRGVDRHFSLERVNKAAASFDPKKLWAFQDWHMQQLPLEQKVERVLPYLNDGAVWRAGVGSAAGSEEQARRRRQSARRSSMSSVRRATGSRPPAISSITSTSS